MIDILKKKHWYVFTYTGNNADGTSGQTWAATYTGYSGWWWQRKRVTKQMIEENKTYAGVESNAVLISVGYLGYMTREEFVGEEE